MLENDLAPAADKNRDTSTIYLKDYQVPDFFIDHVSLDVNLGSESSLITASLSIRRNGSHDSSLKLDGEKLTLISVTVNDDQLCDNQYMIDDFSLEIPDVPNEFVLKLKTELQPHLNTELSGLYQSSGNFCTQCEAEGFRRITYFLDRPDVLSEYTVTITAEKSVNPVLLSNGNLVDQGDNSDGTHWAKWHDPHPKPCYLFALVAGDLKNISDSFTTLSGERVELNIYTQSHNIGKCQHAMESLKKSMRWDEDVYGREYDLSIYNIVAVDDFNMGAMENKGLNIFNSKYVLANQQTATDSDYEGIESVIGHEYFHNWSGNRVTCRDWFQLSLKEGFTVFRDQEFSADMGSRSVKRIRDVQVLRTYQFKEDAGPMAHPIRPESYQEINNFYTVTVYEKGAEVIRMMHRLVGTNGFRKGTDLYFDRFDGQAVTTEDFVQCIEQANNIDLGQFRLWYSQAGTPVVIADQDYSNGVLKLSFKQTCPATPGQPDKQPFQIPITIALFDKEGKKIESQTLELNQVRQTFQFEGLASQPLVSILRDFSAPIKLQFNQSDEELAQLIAHDDNGFARWEAMQRLSMNLIIPALSGNEVDGPRYHRLLNALKRLINNAPEDKAILAEMLVLPSTNYIAEQCSPIDPKKIHAVRENIVQRLSQDLMDELLVLYKSNNQLAEFSLSAEAMAERSLKNTALGYLVKSGVGEHVALAEKQFHSASNMTDQLAAFSCLLSIDYAGRDTVIRQFYEQWQNDSLVLDKWFALQASSPKETILDDINTLMQHPAFSITNPNKVRSLVGVFTSNMIGFHQVSGAGYEFVADQIIELNGINPQVAARLSATFNNWKAYCEPYSAMMKEQLQRIMAEPGLTKDVKEIVSKALM